MWNQIQLSRPPTSSTSTRLVGSADSRLASTQPAEPAPTTIVSNSPSMGALSAMLCPLSDSVSYVKAPWQLQPRGTACQPHPMTIGTRLARLGYDLRRTVRAPPLLERRFRHSRIPKQNLVWPRCVPVCAGAGPPYGALPC